MKKKIKELSKYKMKTEYAIWLAGLIMMFLFFLLLILLHFTPFELHPFPFECAVHSKSGLYCPGCGGTRAFFAFVRGDFSKSLYYHPIVVCVAVWYSIFMIRGLFAIVSHGKYHFMKWNVFYVYIAIGIILTQFLVKNIALICFHYIWMK